MNKTGINPTIYTQFPVASFDNVLSVRSVVPPFVVEILADLRQRQHGEYLITPTFTTGVNAPIKSGASL